MSHRILRANIYYLAENMGKYHENKYQYYCIVELSYRKSKEG